MSFDTLIEIRLKEKTIQMVGKYKFYDNWLSFIAVDLINLLDDNIFEEEKLEELNKSGLWFLEEKITDLDPDIIIDYVDKRVHVPKLELLDIKAFEKEWGVTVFSKDNKLYIDWGGDDIDPVIEATEQIENILPLLSKYFMSFEELKIYHNFFNWCDEIGYYDFLYKDNLIFHYAVM